MPRIIFYYSEIHRLTENNKYSKELRRETINNILTTSDKELEKLLNMYLPEIISNFMFDNVELLDINSAIQKDDIFGSSYTRKKDAVYHVLMHIIMSNLRLFINQTYRPKSYESRLILNDVKLSIQNDILIPLINLIIQDSLDSEEDCIGPIKGSSTFSGEIKDEETAKKIIHLFNKDKIPDEYLIYHNGYYKYLEDVCNLVKLTKIILDNTKYSDDIPPNIPPKYFAEVICQVLDILKQNSDLLLNNHSSLMTINASLDVSIDYIDLSGIILEIFKIIKKDKDIDDFINDEFENIEITKEPEIVESETPWWKIW